MKRLMRTLHIKVSPYSQTQES